MTQNERIWDMIQRFGSVTSVECTLYGGISNSHARMSEARKIYPIKRLKVQAKNENAYGEKPIYYRYYKNKFFVNVPDTEEVVEWIDEIS